MRTARRILALGSIYLWVTVAILPGTMTAASPTGQDITKTPDGQAKIDAAIASFDSIGTAPSRADLVARRFSDGSVLVLLRGLTLGRQPDGSFRVTTSEELDRKAGDQVAALAADGPWTILGSACFAALFKGAAHMDTCYRRYKLSNDGDAGKDYWRIDLYATMFAEGRTLDWGWVAADRDAGPALSFVDWAPDSDVRQNCANFGLSISVRGIGAGYNRTFCELNDISKSAGPAVGWFKDRWSWDDWVPVPNRDRAVGLIIGASSTQNTGSPTWGLSWDFAAH